MKSLTKKELKELHGWVKAQSPYDGCCCDLLEICKHHSDRQETYANQLPPKTMLRLLNEMESLQEQNKLMRVEIRRFRARK